MTTQKNKTIQIDKKKLGAYLKALRLQKRLNVTDFDGISCSSISDLENGKAKKINLLYILKIAAVYDISIVELLQVAGFEDKILEMAADKSIVAHTSEEPEETKELEKFEKVKNVIEPAHAIARVETGLEGSLTEIKNVLGNIETFFNDIQKSLEGKVKVFYFKNKK